MARNKTQSQPTWSDIKGETRALDRAGLSGVVQDLYAASKENRIFLHARFDPGNDGLKSYKKE